MSLLKSGDSSSPFFFLSQGGSSKLFKEFKRYIKQYGLFGKSVSILVAVSGGPDSICLLNLLFLLKKKWDLDLKVAHFNHALRGEASNIEAAFVKDLCEENKIEFFLDTGNVKGLAKEQGLSIQEAARVLRYDFFKKIKKEKDIDFIATGHTADDQAEEVLFRLIRGAGLEGICGILPKREDGVIRPLLFAQKSQIIDHLKMFNIPYIVDSSNLTTKYSRNKVRHLLLTTIKKELNPSIVKTLFRTTSLLQEDELILKKLSFNAKSTSLLNFDELEEDIRAFDIKRLIKEPSAIRRRVFKIALSELGFNERRLLADHLISADKLVASSKPSGFYTLPYDFFILKCNDLIFFIKNWSKFKAKLDPGPLKDGIIIKGPTKLELSGDLGTIQIEQFQNIEKIDFSVKRSNRTLYLDGNKASFPFVIRKRRPGDRFLPLGFSKPIKIKDFLINRHIPRFFRDLVPIVEKDQDILAICNIEINEHYKVSGKNVIKIQWQPKGLLKVIQSAISY